PRPVTLTVADQSRYYGDVNPAGGTVTGTVGGQGFVFGDTVSGATVASTLAGSAHAGTAAALAGSAPVLSAGSNNSVVGDYAFTLNDGTLTVTPRPITVTADAKNMIYGDAVPPLTAQVTLGNLVGSDGLSGALTTSADSTAAVGVYPIAQGTLTAGGDYAMTYVGNDVNIGRRSLWVSAIGSVVKTYDGTIAAAIGTPVFTNVVNGDAGQLSLSGTAIYDTRDVGIGKTVSFSALALGGTAAGNYNLVGAPADSAGNAISQRANATWIGGAAGVWSNPANWDALPDGGNVAAVTIPAGKTVTFDAATAATTLHTLAVGSGGGIVMAGSSLGIDSDLTTPVYAQTGGTLNGPGSFTVTESFSKTGWIFAISGPVSITQASGHLNFVSDAAINLAALTVNDGDIVIDNSGGITTGAGRISAPQGSISLNAHSPITVGSGGLDAGSGIALAASSAAPDSAITLNGALASTSGDISIAAYGDINQNANVGTVGSGGIRLASSTGAVVMAKDAKTVAAGGTIDYRAGGDLSLAQLDAGSGDIALDAGASIRVAAGFTGANLVGGRAVIRAANDLALTIDVQALDVTAGGAIAMTELNTGAEIVAPPTEVLDPTRTVESGEGEHEQNTPPALAPTTSPGSTLPTAGGNQTIGGTEGTFGSGDAPSDGNGSGSASTSSGSSPDKTAAADTDKKEKEDKKEDKETAPAKKDEDRKSQRKLGQCT
ncbi:MAG: hypothetical protein HZC24_03355, partial [Rhodocyclales bacterium]|nr:hypothetical protein [Rhodocyclales bacterium]